MRSSRWIRLATSGTVLIAVGCGGFVARCSDDQECAPESESYCNVSLGACFKRSGGETVPIIKLVVVGSKNITVTGNAPPQSSIDVFLDGICSALRGQTDTNSAKTFSAILSTTEKAGTLSASSRKLATGSLSVCSPDFNFP
jgi:hypothetical protein